MLRTLFEGFLHSWGFVILLVYQGNIYCLIFGLITIIYQFRRNVILGQIRAVEAEIINLLRQERLQLEQENLIFDCWATVVGKVSPSNVNFLKNPVLRSKSIGVDERQTKFVCKAFIIILESVLADLIT